MPWWRCNRASDLTLEFDMMTAIRVTQSAADKVADLLTEEENPNLHLRVYITGGGCSGFQYGFTFDEVVNEDDTIITQICSDGVTKMTVLVDSMSIQYLDNAEIDYTETAAAAQFIIRNPNAKTTCGCGSSFSMDE